ncbi:hypothetical protein LF1_58860 [Rubripirellula obstinata]|uniref:Uncharacterized protein n=1 Tax=Rubripirellula obstinata TaxID=406547 RepID=A0A5B1C8K1_9BACT|nr:hypothetical protein LF1_58860 [Rubripirellula obstinata]
MVFFRITIACTGVAAARLSLCLHVKSRHLGDAYRYPTEPRTLAARLAPCGAHPMPDQHPIAPTPNRDSSQDCPAGHQTTPKFQCSINADVPDALRGINQRMPSVARFAAPRRNLLDQRNFATILKLVVVTHGDEVRADGPDRNGVLRITIACTGVAAAHFSLCLHA